MLNFASLQRTPVVFLGIALASLLRGVPIAGIHPCRDDVSAALWLAGMNVRYKSPSTGHLTAICEIDPIQAEEIKADIFGEDEYW